MESCDLTPVVIDGSVLVAIIILMVIHRLLWIGKNRP
jgi:hypothetical protein